MTLLKKKLILKAKPKPQTPKDRLVELITKAIKNDPFEYDGNVWCAIRQADLAASVVRWAGQVSGRAADAKSMFAAMREAGVEHDIVVLAEQGWRRTREPLPVLLPLLTLAMPSGEHPAQDDEFPKVVVGRNGLPTSFSTAFHGRVRQHSPGS